jgi:ferredoxin
MTAHPIRTASVIYYSQTGNTRRYARYVGHILEQSGLEVETCDVLTTNPEDVPGADLFVVGVPVFYYDIPENAVEWLGRLPRIDGAFGAAFSVFGGEGDNQHNTACSLLDLLAEKGAQPVALGTFSSMSTFAPTWSLGNESRTLAYAHLPDDETYRQVAAFAEDALKGAEQGRTIKPKKRPSITNLLRGRISVKGTKLFITGHGIDENTCIDCGRCEKTCPTGAVDQRNYAVNTKKCIACLGCVNNCPTGALKMKFAGRRVFGLNELRKRHALTVKKPPM